MGFTIDKDQGKEVEPSDAQEARSPIGLNRLWTIRIAALTCCLPLWILSNPIDFPLEIWLGILLFPYVLILLLLSGGMQRTAFGVALAIGLLWVAATLPLCTLGFLSIFQGSLPTSDFAWYVSLLLTHVALVVTAGPAYYRSKRSGEGAGKWIKAITYPLFLVVLFMAGLFHLELMVRESKGANNEAPAISGVRTLVTSQISYSETFGAGTYADSLDSLYASNLIDSVLASGTKDGYMFTVSADAENDSFAIYVRPITYDEGSRSFFSDETGYIRYTTEDRPATVEDKPLGQ